MEQLDQDWEKSFLKIFKTFSSTTNINPHEFIKDSTVAGQNTRIIYLQKMRAHCGKRNYESLRKELALYLNARIVLLSEKYRYLHHPENADLLKASRLFTREITVETDDASFTKELKTIRTSVETAAEKLNPPASQLPVVGISP